MPNFLRDRQPRFTWKPQPVAPELIYADLVHALLRTCHRVHYTLGPGFLHQVYRRATMIELRRSGLNYDYVKQLPVEYEDQLLGYQDVRLIRVEGKVLLATYALCQTADAMVEQLRAYARRLDLRLGLLANFYGSQLQVTPVRVR